MTKDEFAEKLANKCDLSKAKAMDVLDTIFSTRPKEGIIATELDAGRPFLVMERLPGKSLDASLKYAPLPAEEVARIGARVATALHDLHRQHVLHLDLTPDNILFRKSGEAVLADFGLSRQLGIPRAEAARYIATYFERYSGVKRYMERTIAEARALGYVTTLFGRRRALPDINNRNRTVRQFAERTAINTPIQGTAADIIKLAMVNVDRRLRDRGLRSQMILQVHDELIFEVPTDEIETMNELVRHEMESVIALNVPLVVDIKLGPNWYDVKAVAAQ